MTGVAIVIVTHNSGAEIGECLDAAAKTGAEIVVVDNASEDATVREVTQRNAALIANRVNRGFAAAVNQGIQHVTAPLIVLLNPDAVLETGLDALAEACRREGAAGAGGMLVGRDGRPQTGFMVRRFPTATALLCEALLVNRAWPRNRVNWHYRCLDLDHLAPHEVEQPAGAFLMLRRDVWERLGGFDEGFFPIWFEDVDFCKRAAAHGYRMYYVPDAVAKHTGGHSIPQLTVEKRRLYWYGSCLRYTGKHFRPATARLVCAGVFWGAFLRMIVESMSDRTLDPVRVYAKVMRLAASRLISPAAG
jgi:GT2 family glycosyltransferase